ncbi:MAG: carbamoyltransferase C-terminal domain-containing protein [Deltaproteobacteria bacterium]|nr:carbamoyltransferase C-terminal domain-containing protein [Deltaproteobacteria bacterium]
MNVLGISCHYHDSSACLTRNGEVVVAVQEERFNRIKNTSEFPINAINYCVQESGITFQDIDHIGFYEKPFLKFSRVLIDHLQSWPYSLDNFLRTIPHWLRDRLVLPLTLDNEIGFKGNVFFIKHHLSHAAGSFLVSPFEEAAILTGDAVGEWATMTYGRGKDRNINILKEIRYPNSLGLLYTAVTTYLGFAAHEGEGTVMALAGCGKPRYLDKLREIVKVNADGSHIVDGRFLRFNKGSRMYSRKFLEMFGSDRQPETKIDERHCDIAASLQTFTEETLLAVTQHLYNETKLDKLCLGGGLFLNCVANNKILEQGLFRDVFIQPAAGDAGGALGVAAYISNCILGIPRNYVMRHAYLGTGYSDEQIKRVLLIHNMVFKEYADEDLSRCVAKIVADNKIVGWFQGRMELGPRALGNRSILGNPCNPSMKDLLNSKVKKRETFRPYAPVVLEERAQEFFELPGTSPFMLLAPRVRKEMEYAIPGVVHVDGTARVQTLGKDTNQKLRQLIKDFEAITGVPIIINTSFNLRGEPIVCSPENAIQCFRKSEMDYLVLGNFLLDKKDNQLG